MRKTLRSITLAPVYKIDLSSPSRFIRWLSCKTMALVAIRLETLALLEKIVFTYSNRAGYLATASVLYTACMH